MSPWFRTFEQVRFSQLMQLIPQCVASSSESNKSAANQETSLVARQDVLTAIFVKIHVFWGVTPCRLVTDWIPKFREKHLYP
jgi:hypothetical protein